MGKKYKVKKTTLTIFAILLVFTAIECFILFVIDTSWIVIGLFVALMLLIVLVYPEVLNHGIKKKLKALKNISDQEKKEYEEQTNYKVKLRLKALHTYKICFYFILGIISLICLFYPFFKMNGAKELFVGAITKLLNVDPEQMHTAFELESGIATGLFSVTTVISFLECADNCYTLSGDMVDVYNNEERLKQLEAKDTELGKEKAPEAEKEPVKEESAKEEPAKETPAKEKKAKEKAIKEKASKQKNKQKKKQKKHGHKR